MRFAVGIVAAALIAISGWVAWTRLTSTPGIWSPGSSGADASRSLTPVERRQQELLQANSGRPGDPALTERYRDLNARFFDSRLPSVAIRWEPELAGVGALAADAFTLEGMVGRVGKRMVMLLNPALEHDTQGLDRAMCHEMVHVYLLSIGDTTTNHGAPFKAELHRLAAAGAFEGIEASDADKASLRAWLDAESARLDEERQAIETDRATLEGERAVLEVARFNERAIDLNTRIERNRESVDAFNREVARYNLMVAYPDGMDEEAMRPSKPAAAGR